MLLEPKFVHAIWLNTIPLSLSALRGRVILRTLPHLRKGPDEWQIAFPLRLDNHCLPPLLEPPPVRGRSASGFGSCGELA